MISQDFETLTDTRRGFGKLDRRGQFAMAFVGLLCLAAWGLVQLVYLQSGRSAVAAALAEYGFGNARVRHIYTYGCGPREAAYRWEAGSARGFACAAAFGQSVTLMDRTHRVIPPPR